MVIRLSASIRPSTQYHYAPRNELSMSCSRARRFLLIAGAACAFTPAPLASQPPAPATRGTLFIVGGGTQPRELVANFVELASRGGRARIAVLPMASSEPAATGADKAKELRTFGADAFVLNVTRMEASADSMVRRLDDATGIWFTGGDQVRITRALVGSAVLRAIHERFRAGAVVGGTSAGAAIMSDSMMTGDQTRPGVDTTGYFGDVYPHIARKSIVIVPGLGFLPGAIVDQHFIRRERQNRLMSVVLERPTLLGVGIDEGTAMRVDPDGTWRVEGASAAIVYDARDAELTAPDTPRLGATSIRVHVLPAGSTFDPRTGRALLPRR